MCLDKVLQNPKNLKVPGSVHLNTEPQDVFKGPAHIIKPAEPENLKVPQGSMHLNTEPQNVFKGSAHIIKFTEPTNKTKQRHRIGNRRLIDAKL